MMNSITSEIHLMISDQAFCRKNVYGRADFVYYHTIEMFAKWAENEIEKYYCLSGYFEL